MGPLTADLVPTPASPAPSPPPSVELTDGRIVGGALSHTTLVRGSRFAFFWKETSGVFRSLSNWFPSPLSFEAGDNCVHLEQAFMLCKARLFGDIPAAQAVLATRAPAEAKAVGRSIAGFDQEIWDRVKFPLMVRLAVAKFSQAPMLLALLLATHPATLVEASPHDHVWGIGLSAAQAQVVAPADWPGLNLLGQALMRARSLLLLRRTVRDAVDPDIGPCSATPRLDEVLRYPRVKRALSQRLPLLGPSASLSVPVAGDPGTLHDALLIPTLVPLPTSEQLVLLFLVATGGAKPLVFLPVEEGAAVGAGSTRVGTGERNSAVSQAQVWLNRLVGTSPTVHHAFLGGETVGAVRVVVAPLAVVPPSSDVAHKATTRLSLQRRGLRFAWFALAALSASPLLHHSASLAIQRVRVFSDLGAQLPATHLTSHAPFRVGARAVRALVPRPAVSSVPGSATVGEELAERLHHEQRLKNALNVPASHPHAAYLHSLIDSVGVVDLADLTAQDKVLQEKAPSYGDPNFRHFRFSEHPRPPETVYESPILAQPVHCYEPVFTHPKELLTSECADDLEVWLLSAQADLLHVRDNPIARRRPQPFVRGQSCFVPEARGCVWDLRKRGQVPPLAFNEPLRTTLDTSSIRRAFPGDWGVGRPGLTWPDQRLLSYLDEGVRFEVSDALPLQIVLFSHLESAPMGFASLQREVRRFVGLQPYPWMELFNWPPFLPVRCLAHGAAARALEKDRWRSTTEAGGPRYHLLDPDGILVPSLNDLSRSFGFPKEVKPRTEEFAHDATILLSGASLLKETVYVGSDDVKDYFQNLALAPSEFWFSTFLTLSVQGDPGFKLGKEQLAFVAEYRLGFGHFAASNIAQRFSLLLVALIEIEYEVQYRAQLEQAASRQPLLAGWLSDRSLLNIPGAVREDRLHTVKMYTDDIALAAVGPEGFVSLLVAEHIVFSRLNLVMAIAAKRSLGISLLWLGVVFVSCVGIVFVPRSKILRAIEVIQRAIAGRCTLAELRSLLGLLEHIKGVLRVSRAAMHGLWRPFRLGFDPGALYSPAPWAARKLGAWSVALAASSGALALNLLPLSSDWLLDIQSLKAFAMRVTMSADAARAHRALDRRGLGGYFHGFYFHFPLVPFAMELLAIGVLELLALIFAILTFYSLIPPDALVDFETDSLSSTFTLVDEIARTGEGQIAEAHLLASPEFADLRQRGSGKHLFGEGNPCADRASRNKIVELHELCAQMGVRAIAVEPSLAAVRIFHDVLRHAASEAGRESDYLSYAETLRPYALPPPALSMSSPPDPILQAGPALASASDEPLGQEVIKFVSGQQSALSRKLAKAEAKRVAKRRHLASEAEQTGPTRKPAQTALTLSLAGRADRLCAQGKHVTAGAEGPPVKTRRKEVHALSRAVSRLAPTACAKDRDAAQAPPLHWIGPSGTVPL